MNLQLKNNLTEKQQMLVKGEFDKKQKSKGLAYALWFFIGVFGGHRFYSRNPGMGVGMIFTIGGLGIWSLIDVFFIGKRIDEINEGIELDIIKTVKTFENDHMTTQ